MVISAMTSSVAKLMSFSQSEIIAVDENIIRFRFAKSLPLATKDNIFRPNLFGL